MTIIDNAKEVVSLVKKVGDIELYRKIVELEGEVIELTREKRELGDELEKVRSSGSVIDELVFDSPFYGTREGDELYCARCVEADQKAIHLAKEAESRQRRRVYTCPECKSQFVEMRHG